MENKNKKYPEPTYDGDWTLETACKLIVMHKEGKEAILRTDLHNPSNLLIKFMGYTWTLMTDGNLYMNHCITDDDKINWDNLNYIFNQIDFPKMVKHLVDEYKQKLEFYDHCSDLKDYIFEAWNKDWKHLYK
jgi:hypothetical protein